MYDDLNDHPFAAFARGESYVSPSENRWLRWVKRVESLLGHDLDGDQDSDGYSLDFAHASFEAGVTAENYVEELREFWFCRVHQRDMVYATVTAPIGPTFCHWIVPGTVAEAE